MFPLLFLVFCLVNQHVGILSVLKIVLSFVQNGLRMDSKEEERCEVHTRAEGLLDLFTGAGGVIHFL